MVEQRDAPRGARDPTSLDVLLRLKPSCRRFESCHFHSPRRTISSPGCAWRHSLIGKMVGALVQRAPEIQPTRMSYFVFSPQMQVRALSASVPQPTPDLSSRVLIVLTEQRRVGCHPRWFALIGRGSSRAAARCFTRSGQEYAQGRAQRDARHGGRHRRAMPRDLHALCR